MHDVQGKRGTLLQLLAAYMLWTAAGVLGGSFMYLFYKGAGVSLAELVLSFFFWSAAPVFVIHLLSDRKDLDMRTVLVSGVVIVVVSYLLMALAAPNALVLYAAQFLQGMCSFLFWVPFNVMYFEFSKDRAATHGSVYFAINPLFGVFLPLIGAVLASAYGFGLVFVLAALVYALVIPFAFLTLGKRFFSFRLEGCLDGLKGFKTLMFLEGIYGGGITAAIAVIPLLYFTNPKDLGMYLAVTTLFSVLASFVISRLSDRSGKRKRYISLFGSGLGVTTALASFAGTAFLWSAASSLRNFFSTLFYPFTTAIIMDNKHESLEGVFIGREWLLNTGRCLGIGLVFLCTALADIHLSLAFLGLVIAAYPLVVGSKRRHIRVE
jgi:MFS family permease